MESTRQQKIARLMQKELGLIFQTESRNHFQSALITVTKVHVTSDLSLAKVYLSLFGMKDKNALFEQIEKHHREIRHALAQQVGKQLRVVPELEFFIDDSLDYIEKIENLLKNNETPS
ncbi:MAG: 30S ribosome-binding factor RbfA [Lentimicrobiaceae bacterium]|jgi:ribosome-binding factor A|nr:30S ribosome-binding factor RbfA [Lentimicrobiaceae bacterium]